MTCNTRSHFEEQDTWETGVSGNTIASDGWLNRHLLTSQGHGPIRAVSIGDALPRILRGRAPAFAVRGITDLGLFPEKNKSGFADASQARVYAALEHAYCCDPRVAAAAAAAGAPAAAGSRRRRRTIRARPAFLDRADDLRRHRTTQAHHQPSVSPRRRSTRIRTWAGNSNRWRGSSRPTSGWRSWRWITAAGTRTRTRAAATELGGSYGRLVGGLADALAAFAADLENHMDDTLVVTLSDFGRTAAENGTGGTDHGWANCMFAMGGPVLAASPNGPRHVIGNWPGLENEQLHEKRDLLHTTDFRDVLGELVSTHLGNPNIKTILPSHEFKRVGLV